MDTVLLLAYAVDGMEWIARRQPILKFLSSREKAADGVSRGGSYNR